MKESRSITVPDSDAPDTSLGGLRTRLRHARSLCGAASLLWVGWMVSPALAWGDARACAVGDLSACAAGEFCDAPYRDGQCPREGRCRRHLPLPRGLVLSLPVPAGQHVYCAKGPLRTGRSTHSACDPTTRFAIDFAATADERPHFVLAPADGIARVFGGCASPDLNRQETGSDCNLGFGNLVRVEHAPGVYSQLAHLSSILVNDRATVRRGDVLGLEGNTGNAGAKHIHMSLHRGAARVLVPGPTIPIAALRVRLLDVGPKVVSAHELACGDFERQSEPDPRTRVESDNEIGRRPPKRFGFQRLIDELSIGAVSKDARARRWAMGKLRSHYHEPTAPYWLALAYLREGDTRTAAEELQQAFRRAERGEGPAWLRSWCLAFLGEVALAQGRQTEARDLFLSALSRQGRTDPGLRARAEAGLQRVNAR